MFKATRMQRCVSRLLMATVNNVQHLCIAHHVNVRGQPEQLTLRDS